MGFRYSRIIFIIVAVSVVDFILANIIDDLEKEVIEDENYPKDSITRLETALQTGTGECKPPDCDGCKKTMFGKSAATKRGDCLCTDGKDCETTCVAACGYEFFRYTSTKNDCIEKKKEMCWAKKNNRDLRLAAEAESRKPKEHPCKAIKEECFDAYSSKVDANSALQRCFSKVRQECKKSNNDSDDCFEKGKQSTCKSQNSKHEELEQIYQTKQQAESTCIDEYCEPQKSLYESLHAQYFVVDQKKNDCMYSDDTRKSCDDEIKIRTNEAWQECYRKYCSAQFIKEERVHDARNEADAAHQKCRTELYA